MNVLRVALHPSGFAPQTLNLSIWRAHLPCRLQRQVGVNAYPKLSALLAELRGYPVPAGAPHHIPSEAMEMVVVFELAAAGGPLSFISLTEVFGKPIDITLSELAMECVYPANGATTRVLSQYRDGQPG